MKTKTWVLIFALILIVCLGASLSFLAPGEASTRAEITVQGQVIRTVDLRIDQEFTVESEKAVIMLSPLKTEKSVSPPPPAPITTA